MTGQKRDMTELKLVWPVNMTGHRSKIILSPVYAIGRPYRKLQTLLNMTLLNDNYD